MPLEKRQRSMWQACLRPLLTHTVWLSGFALLFSHSCAFAVRHLLNAQLSITSFQKTWPKISWWHLHLPVIFYDQDPPFSEDYWIVATALACPGILEKQVCHSSDAKWYFGGCQLAINGFSILIQEHSGKGFQLKRAQALQ